MSAKTQTRQRRGAVHLRVSRSGTVGTVQLCGVVTLSATVLPVTLSPVDVAKAVLVGTDTELLRPVLDELTAEIIVSPELGDAKWRWHGETEQLGAFAGADVQFRVHPSVTFADDTGAAL